MISPLDALLKNGDFVLDHRGNPVMISGAQELAQRAAIRLAARRGAFPHDPDFGSELSHLRPAGSFAETDARALSAVRRALAPMPQAQVRSVCCAWDASARRLRVRVNLTFDGNSYELEVMP